MNCPYCLQPIVYSSAGIVHSDGFLYCRDLNNRAAKARGPVLVRTNTGISNHTPFAESLKHTATWLSILAAVVFFRLVSMGVIR